MLLCPNCGFGYLHHEKVDVYERGEDATDGLHVAIRGSAKVDRNMKGNPSSRRDGLRIHFSCEGCSVVSFMTIAQHKGQTYLAFEYKPEPPTEATT